MIRSLNSQSKGFILPVLLITTFLIVSITTYVTSSALLTYNLSASETYKVNAQFAVDAGLDKALIDLNSVTDYTGTTGEVELMNNGTVRTTYEVTVTDGATTDRKVVRATGRTYASPTTRLRNTRRYELDAQAVTSVFGPSSVVTGVGGLVMNGNSKITGGDVVVNGTIDIANNAQIGLSTTPLANAVNVRVAHTNCPSPADTTYPRVCNSGENGQPITLGTNAKIYADVRATNQTNGTNMFNPGLIAGQTVPPLTLPDYDRDAQKAAVATTLPSNDSAIDCGNNQTKTWPANVKITGDVSLGNGCTVNLSGDVWLTGNLTFGNNSKVVVPNSMGATTPVIMIDGSNGIVIGNNGTVQANNVGTGAYIIAYWSAASCSPDCSNVTGTDLKNSQNIIRVALDSNGSAPGSILYARWSRTRVANNGAIGAVAGQSIELGNNSVINFTSSVPGSSNLTTTWVKKGYMRVY